MRLRFLTGARERGVAVPRAGDFSSSPGLGISGTVDGEVVRLGSSSFLSDVDTSAATAEAEALRKTGQTVIFVAAGPTLAGLIGAADPIKATTSAAIDALHASGLRVVMLTGDNSTTARAVAAALKLDDVRADMLPADKRDAIRQLQHDGRIVAMAGDGVNDAPALAEAAVGIAMSTGTDVAMESAGITLLHGDLRGIVRARRLSRATMRNVRQNLFLAFAYNIVGIPVAAGVLYPFTHTLISPIWASAAMTLSSVSVIGNALRLRRAVP